jgi:[NiFe] hydrogenase diaphorase moiety small subunit
MSAADARDTFLLDGEPTRFEPGQTVIQAALAAGRYIPHLCYHPEFKPHGSCRVCTVRVNGQTAASCTMPAQADAVESKPRIWPRTAARWYRCCS